MNVIKVLSVFLIFIEFVLFHLYVFKIENELHETQAKLKKHIESEVESNDT